MELVLQGFEEGKWRVVKGTALGYPSALISLLPICVDFVVKSFTLAPFATGASSRVKGYGTRHRLRFFFGYFVMMLFVILECDRRGRPSQPASSARRIPRRAVATTARAPASPSAARCLIQMF